MPGLIEVAVVVLFVSAAVVYVVLRLVVWPPFWLQERRLKMLRPLKDKRVKGPGERGSPVKVKKDDDHCHRRQTDKEEDERTRESTCLG
jgi:hypothetical protein